MPATSAPELESIKNVLDVDVDALHHKNTHTIRAMYNATDHDGFASITQKIVDRFDLTWKEIEEEGGVSAVNRDLHDCYGV